MNRIRVLVLLGTIMLTACTTIDGPTDPEDPYEGFNRSMYQFNAKVDEYALKPLAQGYDAITPDPVQKGIGNFFSNLDDFLVIINDLLQLKFSQALSDTGRLLINSTIGIYGLIDWASDLGLEKHEEDFGQTLGYWGVPSGPYLVMPIFGPGSLRDSPASLTETYYLSPINKEVHEGTPFPDRGSEEALGLTLVDAVDTRARLLGAERLLGVAALDPYIFVRDAYLQRRQNLVYDGNPPEDEDFWDEEIDIDDL